MSTAQVTHRGSDKAVDARLTRPDHYQLRNSPTRTPIPPKFQSVRLQEVTSKSALIQRRRSAAPSIST